MPDIDGFLLALTHGDDLVSRTQAALARVPLGGASGNQADDLGGAVLGTQQGTDPDQGEAHFNVKIFSNEWRHVARVGIEGMRKRTQILMEHPVGIAVLQDDTHLVVTLEDRFLRRQARRNVLVFGVCRCMGGPGIREQVGRVADQISDHVDKIEAIGFRGGNRDRSRVGLV